MVELIDFLHARINEDEQTAKKAIDAELSGNGTWRAKDDGTGTGLWGYVMSGHYPICGHDIEDVRMAHADHIARHDPARVLREIEAKRAILAQEEEARAHYGHIKSSATHPGVETSIGHVVALATVIRHLAAVYSDHPDYNPEWTP